MNNKQFSEKELTEVSNAIAEVKKYKDAASYIWQTHLEHLPEQGEVRSGSPYYSLYDALRECTEMEEDKLRDILTNYERL